MGSIEDDFHLLVSGLSGPVPVDYLQNLFNGLEPLNGEAGRGYSDTEKRLLLDLAGTEKDKLSRLTAATHPLWLSSAGGPGAGKTIALFQYVAQLYGIQIPKREWLEPSLQAATRKILKTPTALASPDKQGLLLLARHIGNGPTGDAGFYKKWLSASYFLSRIILNAGFTFGLNVVHDTTMSGSYALQNLQIARDRGYYVAVLMQGASTKTRQAATEKRNAAFFQSLPENVRILDNLFGAKIPEIACLSDEVVLAWRDAAESSSKPVAMILDNKFLAVVDQKRFEYFCHAYPAMYGLAETLEQKDASAIRSRVTSVMNEGERVPVGYGRQSFSKLSPA